MLDDAKILATDIMTRDVAVIHPETNLVAAVKLMASLRVSSLPVVDGHGLIVGMMGEADLLRWHEELSEHEVRRLNLLADGFDLAPEFLREIQNQHRKISVLMSANPITVTETTPAREIASLMHARGISSVPVLHDGKLVGIVSRGDLVRALAQKLSERVPPAPTSVSVDEALRLARDEAVASAKATRSPPLL